MKHKSTQKEAEELLDLVAKHPNAQKSTFYIGRDGDNNPVIQELTSQQKLDLMDKIAGEEIWLKKGESREKKIYRLTVVFSEFLDITIRDDLEVSFRQIDAKSKKKEKKIDKDAICIIDEGELFVWKFIDQKILEKGGAGKKKSKKRKEKKKFSEFSVEKPQQLSLFSIIEKDYSHTIELYDFIPKFVWGKVDRVNGKFLEPVTRNFVCKKIPYRVTLMPAKIETKKGNYKDYFPGKREELVEDALRKIMSERKGVILDELAGTTFTLYELQNELKVRGHSYSYDQLKESLNILSKTTIELESEENEIKIVFRPIETLGLSGKDGETQTFVRFSPLVTRSLKKGTYRLINYDKVMTYKTVIARQLHKRMSHHYTQASLSDKYSILLSTIIRDFGLTQFAQIRNNMLEVKKALLEMKEKYVILDGEMETIYDQIHTKRIKDYRFTIQPHPAFINDIKKANTKNKAIRKRLESSGSE